MHFARGKSGSESKGFRQADQLALVIPQWIKYCREKRFIAGAYLGVFGMPASPGYRPENPRTVRSFPPNPIFYLQSTGWQRLVSNNVTPSFGAKKHPKLRAIRPCPQCSSDFSTTDDSKLHGRAAFLRPAIVAGRSFLDQLTKN
jgi:hypothetical protein